MFSLVPICFCLTLNLLHATSIFLKCPTWVLSAATHLGIAKDSQSFAQPSWGCALHISQMSVHTFHAKSCCYNISTIVLGNGLDFLRWSVKFGNYLNPFCNICSYVSLFQGHCCQAVGHHFPIIQMVAHQPHISLYCEHHAVSLLQGFLHLLFDVFLLFVQLFFVKKVLDGSS